MERDHWMERDVEKDTSDRVSVHLDCPSLDVCFLSLPRFDGWYGFILMQKLVCVLPDNKEGVSAVTDVFVGGGMFIV